MQDCRPSSAVTHQAVKTGVGAVCCIETTAASIEAMADRLNISNTKSKIMTMSCTDWISFSLFGGGLREGPCAFTCALLLPSPLVHHHPGVLRQASSNQDRTPRKAPLSPRDAIYCPLLSTKPRLGNVRTATSTLQLSQLTLCPGSCSPCRYWFCCPLPLPGVGLGTM